MASRAWMFCPYTGALLDIDALTGIASCTQSSHKIDVTSALSVHPKHPAERSRKTRP